MIDSRGSLIEQLKGVSEAEAILDGVMTCPVVLARDGEESIRMSDGKLGSCQIPSVKRFVV
jgi:hypothetical protein